MAGNSIIIQNPVSKDEIKLTEQDRQQYQEILNAAIQIEENHNSAIEEINKGHRRSLKKNEQHYRKYKELKVELEQGKLTTESFNPVDNLSYNTIQKGLLEYQDKLKAAEEAKDLEVVKHKEALETLQDKLVYNHRIIKAKAEYSDRLKEDVDRCKLIVSTLKEQIKKPPLQLTKLSLEHLERDLKKYK